MTINTDIKHNVFGDGEFPVDESILDNITEEQRQLVRGMMKSGYYRDGIHLSSFLREDLTINLELLELAVTLSIIASEANSDLDVTLKLRGLEEYYQKRGVLGNPKQENEERIFMLGFVTAIAAEASKNDTLEVKYVK